MYAIVVEIFTVDKRWNLRIELFSQYLKTGHLEYIIYPITIEKFEEYLFKNIYLEKMWTNGSHIVYEFEWAKIMDLRSYDSGRIQLVHSAKGISFPGLPTNCQCYC